MNTDPLSGTNDGFAVDRAFRPFPQPFRNNWRNSAFTRLDDARQTAVPLPFDDQARIVIISDCHRGDGSGVDRFARNKAIYHAALDHYFAEGFTYIENGDGDELWDNGSFAPILAAHRDTFSRLHQFHGVSRLYLLIGNHEMYNAQRYLSVKDGLPTYHSLLLTHVGNGTQLLVLHGHQGDMSDGRSYPVSRFLYRTLLRRTHWREIDRGSMDHRQDQCELTDPARSHSRFDTQGMRIAQVIGEWIDQRQLPVLCGHTHLPAFPATGATPYVNSGCCVHPGYLTCLELQHGALTLVKWSLGDDGPRREALVAPRPVAALALR